MRTPEEPSENCPVCGEPRLGVAWDCAKCGFVYDGVAPAGALEKDDSADDEKSAESSQAGRPAPAASPAARAPSSSSARRGGTASRQHTKAGSPSALEGFRSWVGDNLPLAIGVAVALYLGVSAFISTQLVAGTDDLMTVRTRYRKAVGDSPPTAFDTAFGINIVGRKLSVFVDQFGGNLLVLYNEGWLAGGSDERQIERAPESLLMFLELEWRELPEQQGKVADRAVPIRTLMLKLANGVEFTGYVASFDGDNGRPALLCLIGETRSVGKTARHLFGVS